MEFNLVGQYSSRMIQFVATKDEVIEYNLRDRRRQVGELGSFGFLRTGSTRVC